MESNWREHAEEARNNIDINIFKGYDVRGDAQITEKSPHIQLRPEDAFLIGQAIGSEYIKKGQTPRVLITADHRPSSETLRDALSDGFASAGGMVQKSLEPTPTGATSWAILQKRDSFDVSVQITGSHNPYYNNGFKITCKQNEKEEADKEGIPRALYGERLKEVYHRIKKGDVVKDGSGEIKELEGLVSEYQKAFLDYFKTRLPRKEFRNSFRVILDAGNGLGCYAVDILRGLGVDVVEMFTELDGVFPNHPADPSAEEGIIAAQRKVRDFNSRVSETERPWIGLVFDGDGDRCGVIAEDGRVLYPERILSILYLRFIIENKAGLRLLHRLKEKVGLAFDVRGTGVISDLIESYQKQGMGITGEYIPCGYPNHRSYVNRQIQHLEKIIKDHKLSPEEEENLRKIQRSYTSAESSGHFFYATCQDFPEVVVDDGIFSALKLLEIIDSIDSYEAKEGIMREKKEYLLEDVINSLEWKPVSNEIRGASPYEEEKKNQVIEAITQIVKQEQKNSSSRFKFPISEIIDVDGVRVMFNDGSFFLVRASQTSPKFTYKFEAPQQKRLIAVMSEIISFLEEYEKEGLSTAELKTEWRLQKGITR